MITACGSKRQYLEMLIAELNNQLNVIKANIKLIKKKTKHRLDGTRRCQDSEEEDCCHLKKTPQKKQLKGKCSKPYCTHCAP